MSEAIYRRLQERLDLYSMGFPPTASGVEIEILKELFSPDQAELFLALTPKLEIAEAVAQRIGGTVEETASRLERMARKGLLFRRAHGNGVQYGAIPFVHGLFEFQVNRLSRRLAALVEQYHREGFNQSIVQSAGAFLRTVPIGQSVDVTHNIAAYEDACEILRSKDRIVVADCICRKQQDAIGEGCGKPLEVCFMFGSMGQYYLDHHMGRSIELDEALKIVENAQASGLVTQPATARNPGGMCNCCGDCCGVLKAINRHPKPAEMVFSNYYAAVDQDLCTGCETCVERCQMAAVTLDDEGLAVIHGDRCIGCGLCVPACPAEAVRLISKPPESRQVPPGTTREQMIHMAEKRGLIPGGPGTH